MGAKCTGQREEAGTKYASARPSDKGTNMSDNATLGDLFPPEYAAELRYLMKRARRTGLAASQVDLERQSVGVLGRILR